MKILWFILSYVSFILMLIVAVNKGSLHIEIGLGFCSIIAYLFKMDDKNNNIK